MPNSVGRRKSSARAQLCIACALAGFLLMMVIRGSEPATRSSLSPFTPATTAVVVRTKGVPEIRPVYRHSVVRGGVYSNIEASAAVQADAVVRAHYKAVNVSTLRPIVLDRAVDRYVSFRRDDRIYWTARRLRVPKGELLLSDRESLVRARCGNRLADTPQQPTVPSGTQEPTDAELSSTEETDSTIPSVDQDSASLVPVAIRGDRTMPLPLAAGIAEIGKREQAIHPPPAEMGSGYPAAAAQQSLAAASALIAELRWTPIPQFTYAPVPPTDPSLVVVPPLIATGTTTTATTPTTTATTSTTGPVATGGTRSFPDGRAPRPGPSSAAGGSPPPSSAATAPSNLPPTSAFVEMLGATSGTDGSEDARFPAQTPEPGTLTLCVVGLAAAFVTSRRRAQS